MTEKEEIIIVDEEEFTRKKQSLINSGAAKIHIISDFDRTLTKASVGGAKAPSIMALLRDGDYLNEDYRTKATELAQEYHPIEINPRLSLSEKKIFMHEWWSKHFKLLVESGLEKSDLEKVILDKRIKFRDGVEEMIKRLKENSIPLIILSSSGLGETIKMIFEKNNLINEDTVIITNEFLWDSEGKAVGIKEPIIHVFNKDETSVMKHSEAKKKVAGRKNVILLGDSLGDLGMAEGFPYEEMMGIGFLNPDEFSEENLIEYKKAYDVVILGDGSMEFMNELLDETIIK